MSKRESVYINKNVLSMFDESEGKYVEVSKEVPIPISLQGNGRHARSMFNRPDDAIAYNAGDVMGTIPASNMVFSDLLYRDGVEFVILGVRFSLYASSVPVGMSGFNLHLFDSEPTPIVDNASFTIVDDDRDKYLGYISLSAPVKRGVNLLWCQEDNVNFAGKLPGACNTLYGVLETLGTCTVPALCLVEITLNVAEV